MNGKPKNRPKKTRDRARNKGESRHSGEERALIDT